MARNTAFSRRWPRLSLGLSGVVYTFLGRGKVFSEPSCLYWRCSVLAAGDCSTAKRGGSKRPAGKRNHPGKKELRFAWPLGFGRLFSQVLGLYFYCNGDAATNGPTFPYSHYWPLCFPNARHCEEKATGETGKHQHRDVRRIAASSRDRARNGGKDFANAQIVRRLQERGRFAGHSRPRSEAPRKNAQVLDCREASCGKERRAPSEGHSSGRKAARQTIREISPRKIGAERKRSRCARNDGWTMVDAGAEIVFPPLGATGGANAASAPQKRKLGEMFIRAPDAWAWVARCGGGPGRRCERRSLLGRRLFSGDW